ncbi:hypothetical protein AT1G39070 [Arabidopsis thaliana]|uniref:Uncharacterized protein n=1 Tax=Arabidopsis thaliana TaxID=3702 RepID=A0A1P8ARQ6_ARATH|nr:uncharacterized protein AT1G39070 [Arabidopsis thaliana]ANM59339.1 hypothetical protein AT1G39070 [Arabidopsis thaliana]|eukprot:NP_001321704.1 hypothetical protein AT1G39070 [Arabidopsis thaliana]
MASFGRKWVYVLSKHPNPSLTLIISQMHWIVKHFDHKNTNKTGENSLFWEKLGENGYKCCLNTPNPSLTLIITSSGRNWPLLRENGYKCCPNTPNLSLSLIITSFGRKWVYVLSKHSNPSLTLIISQMHWIVTHFDHKNTNKTGENGYKCCLNTPNPSLTLKITSSERKWPLLGQNGYKCCLNTPNPSLTLMISQMHWILTHFDHKNTNKNYFKEKIASFGRKWVYVLSKHPNPSLTLIISQMHWIVKHFDHKNTNKTGENSLFWEKMVCFRRKWPLLGEIGYKCCPNIPNLSLSLIISQMHWIVTHFDHRNTNKTGENGYKCCLNTPNPSLTLIITSSERKWPLLGQNGYKCCLNTPNPSLTLMISQMHWILTHFDHKNTNKICFRRKWPLLRENGHFRDKMDYFKEKIASFGRKWVYVLSKHSNPSLTLIISQMHWIVKHFDHKNTNKTGENSLFWEKMVCFRRKWPLLGEIGQMHWIVTHFDHRNTNKTGENGYKCCLNTPNPSLTLIITSSERKWPLLGQNGYKCCLNTPNPSLTLMISQMHWILTHFDHKNTNKSPLLGENRRKWPLLGEIGYKCCPNIPNLSLSLIISQMHWIVTHFDHRNTNKTGENGYKCCLNTPNPSLTLIITSFGRKWVYVLSKHSNPSLTLIISQMHWIVTHFDHKNTNKTGENGYKCCLNTPNPSLTLIITSSERKWPLLGQNGYKCCLNTPNPSLTLMISQMHWILTHFDHKNTNKSPLLGENRRKWPLLGEIGYKCCPNIPNLSLSLIISQMHWIVTHFDHRNTNKTGENGYKCCLNTPNPSLTLIITSFERKWPLLGQNGYKCCLNTPNPSLTRENGYKCCLNTPNPSLTLIITYFKEKIASFGRKWVYVLSKHSNPSLTLIISQMHWIVTHFDHKNTNKTRENGYKCCLNTPNPSLTLRITSFGTKRPLLGENGYKYCLNTPNPSLTLIKCQMHWIVTHCDHKNTNKTPLLGENSLFWEKMDAMGQVVDQSGIQDLNANNKPTKKIDFHLRDQNDTRLACILWGKYAEIVDQAFD